MKWWRSLSFIHESRFIGLFSLLWSAKTPHKICDTNFLMTCVYKLTMFLTVVPFQLELCEIWWLLRYFKTSFSYSGGGNPPLPLNAVYFVQILQLNVEFWKSSFCSVTSYKVKKQLLKLRKTWNLSILEKLWPFYYKYADIWKILQNSVWNKEKLKIVWIKLAVGQYALRLRQFDENA